jgi:hypothetical protein
MYKATGRFSKFGVKIRTAQATQTTYYLNTTTSGMQQRN